MRNRGGPLAQATGRVQAAVAVTVDDFVKLAGNYVTPYGGADTPTTFHDVFAGVLAAGQQTGTQADDHDCLLHVDGHFEYPLDVPVATEAPVGSLVSIFDKQTVTFTGAALATAIGKLIQRAKVGDTTVRFRITPIIPLGGIQAPA